MSTHEGEEQPLLPNSYTRKSQWSNIHTICGILIRIIGDLLQKINIVFYEDFTTALGLTNVQFSAVIVSQQLGAIVAMLLLPSITQFIPSLQRKIITFGFLCGIFSILFTISPIISNNTYFILIWSCIDKLLSSIAFFIYITSILDLASQTNNSNSGKQGKIISLLNISWTIASLFYFITGYIIQYLNWWFTFVLFGIILCIISIISHFVYLPFVDYGHEINDNNNFKIYTIFSTKSAYFIYIISIIMGCFQYSFQIIVGSVWLEEIFHLNSFHVGLVTLSIFCGELIACLSLSKLIDKCGVFKCAILCFISILTACIITLILWYLFGPKIGGLGVFIVIMFLLFYGWESLFIIQQMLCIQNAPSNEFTSNMLIMNFAGITMGNMIGSYLAPLLWDNGNGIGLLNIVWISFIVAIVVLYVVIYCAKSRPHIQR
eukprot:306896_1